MTKQAKQTNRTKWLEEQIALAQQQYYNEALDDVLYSDAEYDALVEELAAINAEHPLLTRVGAEPETTEWVKEKHPYPLGSLYKVNTADQISEWINETLEGRSVLLSEKLDGLSLGCRYENGKLVSSPLRGSGIEGENILANVLKMQGIVEEVPGFTGVIRGEIILTKSNLATHFPDYANPRNAASGLCRRLDGEGCQHLSFMAYQVFGKDFKTEEEQFQFLAANKFLMPYWKLCNKPEEVIALWEEYQAHIRDSLDHEVDGLVMACNDRMFGESLGETNLRPKGKMAIKFPNQFIKTTVKSISWDTGSMGRITPVCWVEPVDILGSTVQKASIYNIAYIEKLGIDVGAEVEIGKAGEIIPRIERVVKSTGTVVSIPTSCATCNEEVVMSGEYLVCPNTAGCASQIEGRIKNWIKELDVLEVGDGLIEKLVASGLVKTPADLYILTVEQLEGLDRMGKRSSANVHKSIWGRSPVSLDVFLGGLSIHLIGGATIRLLMAEGYDTLDKIQALSAEEMQFVKGIGANRATSLAEGLIKNKEIIVKLQKNGLEIEKTEGKAEAMEGKFSGQSFCFTGKAENKRDVLEGLVVANGGEAKSSVVAGLTYLVLADPDSTSTKANKARKSGVKLISENEFLEMAGE